MSNGQHRRWRRALWIGTTLLTFSQALPAKAIEGSQYRPAAVTKAGIVVSPSLRASRAGAEILRNGGNAIDAAVATVFAIGVTRPGMCGIGGGGSMLYRSAGGETAVLDFQRAAPAAMTPTTVGSTPEGIDQYLLGHLVVGVPGVVAGMAAAHGRYGTVGWADLIAPAERYARGGFTVTAETELNGMERAFLDELRLFPETAEAFLDKGQPYANGSRFVQKDHADTLRRIAREGTTAFYHGLVARQIVEEMARGGRYPGDEGILTLDDLAAYRVHWTTPLHGTYRGREILATPAPSSGAGLLEMLNLLEGYDLSASGLSSPSTAHLLGEVDKIAGADYHYLADPDYVDVPEDILTSKAYAAERRREISLDRAKLYEPGLGSSPSSNAMMRQPGHTANIAVVDAAGNAVDVTCTLGNLFGSAVTVGGAGFLLNDLAFDAPGTPNQAEGGKRMGSAISPMMMLQGGQPVLVAGSAGSEYINQSLVRTVTGMVDFGLDLAHAVDVERFGCFNVPGENSAVDDCYAEGDRFGVATLSDLEGRGHGVTDFGEYGMRERRPGEVEAVAIDAATGDRLGVSDPRSAGWGTVTECQARPLSARCS